MPDSLQRSRSFVSWTLRHGVVLWSAALVLAIPASIRAANLYAHLRTELEQLLPKRASSVVAIEELRARMPGLQYLGVIVDSGTEEHLAQAERLLDDLAARIRSYPPWLVRDVRSSDRLERRFLEEHAALYVDTSVLASLRDRLEARRDYEVAKETAELLDEGSAPPPLDFRDIEHRYDDVSHRGRHLDDDRLSNRALHLTLLLVQLGNFETGRARGQELLRRIKADLSDLGGPDHYAPGMRLGFTGDVAISVEETSALAVDLAVSGVVVIVLVAGVILAYYRWLPSILILGPPLLLATVYTFAVASLPPLSITELNSNTAFLGSIIVGNGINFGIVLLGRYVEERRRACPVRESLALAVWSARGGTLAAALAAGASYASLALTNFRGFRQFGFIGGIGMVLSWLVAFVLMPPLLAWVDRSPSLPAGGRVSFSPMEWIARLVETCPRLVCAVSLVITLGSLVKVSTIKPSTQLETDFSRLRRADTWKSGEGYWGRRMEALLGTYLTPAVLLTDDVPQALAIARAISEARNRPPLSEQVASIRTIDDVVPPDQGVKLELLSAIHEALTPRIRSLVAPDTLRKVDDLLDSARTPITPTDLPYALTAGLRERDGTLGREVLVYPRPSHALWEGGPLDDFVAALRRVATVQAAPGDRPARVAGSLPLSADILASVRRDAPRASLAALLGVLLAVALVLRAGRNTWLVIASLLVSVLWLAAATSSLGMRVSFANFIAYPITFGIGVDYVVNIVNRQAQDPGRDIGTVIRTTGGAVALCSMTTILGYSSLLMAQNRGLFSFGTLAVSGEIACLSTALLTVPALLRWARLRAGSSPGEGAPS